MSFGLTANLVLCRTAAGQVEIESALADGCCTSHGVPEQAHAPDDCGCVDTPLLQTPLDRRSQLDHAPTGAPHAAAGLLATFPPVRRPPSSRFDVRPPGSALVSLTALRSVVLLV